MSIPARLGGRSELRGVLGRGGMAEVREAWDSRLGRVVAVKLLHPGLSDDADGRARFETEARSAAALSHPNIVAVYDFGEHDGTPYIVMERLPGFTLADQIALSPLPQSRVRTVIDDVLSALSVAHDAGILHRDIKPGNILFTTQGHTKVADFGIAKIIGTSHTQTGQIVGTLAYLSPDRLAGKPATVTDDLYAVGCVGYEALTGRRPFPDEALGALARAIMDDTPPPLPALRQDVDPTLAAAIEQAMARDPRQRFGGAADMRTALWNPVPPPRPSTRVLTAAIPAAPPPSAYIPSAAEATPRHWLPKVFAMAGVIAALALTVVLLVRNSPFHSDAPAPAPTVLSSTPPAAPVVSSSAAPTPTPASTPSATANLPNDQPGNGNKKGGHGKGKDKP
jgi:serine/threonine protein kinase